MEHGFKVASTATAHGEMHKPWQMAEGGLPDSRCCLVRAGRCSSEAMAMAMPQGINSDKQMSLPSGELAFVTQSDCAIFW